MGRALAVWLVSSLGCCVSACDSVGNQGPGTLDEPSDAAVPVSYVVGEPALEESHATNAAQDAKPADKPDLPSDPDAAVDPDPVVEPEPLVEPEPEPEPEPVVEPEPVGTAAHFIDIDSDFVRCGVKTDHTLWCWGQSTNWGVTWQQALYPTQYGSDADWQSVSVGGYSVCGLRGQGSIHCFGYLYTGGDAIYGLDLEQSQVGADDEWQSLSNGALGACAIKKDGSLWCWGYLSELSDGAIEGTLEPLQIGTDHDWSVVSTNGYRACGIKTDGTLLCFGSNADGGNGDGTTVDSWTPHPVTEPGPWLDVATGERTCGLRADHTLWCWGSWGSVTGTTPAQVDPNDDWQQIHGHNYGVCGLRAGGKVHCLTQFDKIEAIDESGGYTQAVNGCALREDQTARCWGWSAKGDGKSNLFPTPVNADNDADWQQVAIGAWNVIGLHADGRLESYPVPQKPETGSWREISFGNRTYCGIRDDGTLWCWGGYFGTGDAQLTNSHHVPVQVGNGADWLHTALAGTGWMCGIRATNGDDSGTLWCEFAYYNKNAFQQPFDDWQTVSAAANTGCGVRANGSLWCWNMKVTCGYGGFYGEPQFEQVGTDLDWASASVGAAHVCAIKRDGSLWCRGQNYAGALGIGSHAAATEMTPVAPGTTWREVEAGYLSTCGVQVDGSLWCWGDNRYGLLGVGWPGANRTVPERVGSATDWHGLALAKSNEGLVSCGLRGASLWCWGDDQNGNVQRQQPDRGPATVLDAPEPLSDFCLVGTDHDFDGYNDCQGDCDDNNADVSPYQAEACNGIDDNCDGSIDEGCP